MKNKINSTKDWVLQPDLFYIFAAMRNLVSFVIFIIVFANQMFGQGLLPPGGEMESDTTGQSRMFEDVVDSDVVSAVRAWKLENGYTTVKPVDIDTSTIDFHNYNPVFKQSISNNHLGYLGAPYENNQFFDRKLNSRFYFLQHLDIYHLSSPEVTYYNTTTPYASLMYDEGNQSESRGLQVFEAFFTRNIDSVSNFGFTFDVIKNKGQYKLQEANHKNLNFFASRNGERYNGYFSIVNKNNDLVNNGGIISPTINVDFNPFDLPVNLPGGLITNNKSFSVFTSHEYLMGRLPFWEDESDDSISSEFVPAYSVQYTVEFDSYKRHVIENGVDPSFFENSYINERSHTDSVFFSVFSHAFHLKAFENEERKYTFGKRAFIENEIVRAVHPLAYGQRIYTYSNVFLGGEIYSTSGDFWKWNAMARFAMIGRNIGDAIVKGSIEKPFVLFHNDTTSLHVEGWYSDVSADIFHEHWQSNHFKWENSFKKQHEVVLRSSFNYPRYKAKAGFDYALYSNYFYNNALALPDQYNGEFSVISAWLNKDFHFWRFIWANKVVWQAISNQTALRLPAFSAYSSFYYSHVLFKVMKINLGAEVYYNTPYKANQYEPSTTRFYIQDELLTGGYPLVNLFANAKLKRTSAFVKYEHANSWLKFGEFFASPTYPWEQMAFRFGFLWTFYD